MAYYSNQGATIRSGAAGVGALMSFQDGSLGKLQAYQDGSLGMLQAYQDGSLGMLQSYQDGSLGASPDGLGSPLYVETPSGSEVVDGPIIIHHGVVADQQVPPAVSGMGEYFAPNRGMGEYFAPNRGMGEYFATNGLGKVGGCGCKGLGAALPANVLDLKNPEAITEAKTVMGMAPFMMDLSFGDKARPEFNAEFFKRGYWDSDATKMATLFQQRYVAAFPQMSTVADSLFAGTAKYPSPAGIVTMLALLGYKQPVQAALDFKYVPVLTAFYDAINGDPSKGSVVEPNYSAIGASGIKASTLALVGVGVLALGFVLLRKK